MYEKFEALLRRDKVKVSDVCKATGIRNSTMTDWKKGRTTPKALCYVNDWYTGFAVLTAYKAGTYEKGMEKDLKFTSDTDDVIQRIIEDYSSYRCVDSVGKTFADIYELYYQDKYGDGKRKYSASTKQSTKVAFNNCKALWEIPFAEITLDDLQSNLDSCPLKHSSLELIKSLYHGMYGYAVPHDLAEKDLSKYVKIKKPDDDVHGVPFSDSELLLLWENRESITACRLIVMCLSGFRIGAYPSLKIDHDIFIGGIKTSAGKGRHVPVHSSLVPLLDHADISSIAPKRFRIDMYRFLESVGIQKHTPHDCRHTFSYLCDKYGVNPIAKKKMLGHKIQGDISNSTYGHWSDDMLKKEICKIKFP